VCLDVARDAMDMHNAGKSVREIRAAIEATYRPHFGTMTPTSPPPSK
jgi:hypothetical protein